MPTMTFDLPEALDREIAREARRRKLPKAAIVLERVSMSPPKPSGWDLIKDLVIDDPKSPGDLSNKKKHLAAAYARPRARR
jgi:hypothetical protein